MNICTYVSKLCMFSGRIVPPSLTVTKCGISAVATSVGLLARDVYRALTETDMYVTGNFAFSPLGIASTLASLRRVMTERELRELDRIMPTPDTFSTAQFAKDCRELLGKVNRWDRVTNRFRLYQSFDTRTDRAPKADADFARLG